MLEAIGKLDAMSAVQTTLFNKMEEILNILKSKPPFSPAAESIPIAGAIITIEYDTSNVMHFKCLLQNLKARQLTYFHKQEAMKL